MSMKDTSAITPTNISDLEPTLTSQLQNLISAPEETRNKKSQNMTECVPVPSSEHVAEIVGRQGCKIKALRAKTNTYIKTPVRGEEPVFVVTGRKEDVAKAKREIISAASHFTQIRASRKNNLAGGSLTPPGPPINVPGHTTIEVRVPYRVVGLVVGPKGATIKRIQHQTQTYIVTPSRDKEPVFEVTGLPENVEQAKHEIEAHIAVRTGTGNMSPDGMLSNSPVMEDGDLLNSLCKSGFGSLFNYTNSDTALSFPPFSGSSGCSSAGSASSSSSNSGANPLNDLCNIWNMSSSLDRDEGIGDSPSFETANATSNIWSYPSVTRQSASPTDSLCGKRDCVVCGDKEVTAALVPCGHNLFCLECANKIKGSANATCPICSTLVMQAIRIIS